MSPSHAPLSEEDRAKLDVAVLKYRDEMFELQSKCLDAMHYLVSAQHESGRAHMQKHHVLATPTVTNVVEAYRVINEATTPMSPTTKTLIYIRDGDSTAALKFVAHMTGLTKWLPVLEMRQANAEAIWVLAHCTHPLVGKMTDPPPQQLEVHMSDIDGVKDHSMKTVHSLNDVLALVESGKLSRAKRITICGNIPMLGPNVSLWCIPRGNKMILPAVKTYMKHVIMVADNKSVDAVSTSMRKRIDKGDEPHTNHILAVITKDEEEAEEVRGDLHDLDVELLMIPQSTFSGKAIKANPTKWLGDVGRALTIFGN